MKLAIITHVVHIPDGESYSGYSAYVREMNIWGKYATELLIAAPLVQQEITNIHSRYQHSRISLRPIPAISFTSFAQGLRSLVLAPLIAFRLWKVMRAADHIHLRCPGTIGLIACLVQILFPKKPKTAKYAGNWDPKAKQPLSYRFQKRLLAHTFFTRNMKVLVYGEWPNQSKNIAPFFTASYAHSKVGGLRKQEFKAPFRFVFVGSLSIGKRPIYAMQLVALLREKGLDCHLDYYGDGIERKALEDEIAQHGWHEFVTLQGNQTASTVEEVYKESDFLILPSKSEGWPKVIAEAMFWGCIPVATQISCVSWMLGHGERGILLSLGEAHDLNLLLHEISQPDKLAVMSEKAQLWSQQYTLDRFEDEIQKFL